MPCKLTCLQGGEMQDRWNKTEQSTVGLKFLNMSLFFCSLVSRRRTGVFDLCPWLWDSDGKGMRNQGAKVERTLDADTAGLSRDAAQCWVLAGLRCQETPPHMPADRCGSSRLTKPALLLWRCQMWNCVNRVTWRPFLLSDLYQKCLFLETATTDCALGKKASRTLLLFLNISVHLGLCSKMYVKK